MESKPVFELHKLPEGFIITSDEIPHKGNIVINNLDNLIGESTRELNQGEIKDKEYSKVIAQQDQIDFSALSEEEQKEIGWFDVEELASKEYSPNIYNSYAIDGYKKGFQKSQELLSDRRFTLEDVQIAITQAFLSGMERIEEITDVQNHIIQSLSQKSWKVEIELEQINNKPGASYSTQIIYKPLLTNNKVKIIKLL